jgi:uncharacterized protein
MNRTFEWNPDKARSNFRKHGIDFETATVAFDDPFAIVELERIENGEERWHIIGMGVGAPLLLVVHAIRDVEEIEIIRIISARRAERSERRRYEQQAS